MKANAHLCPPIAAAPLGREPATTPAAFCVAAGVADGRAVLSDPGDT